MLLFAIVAVSFLFVDRIADAASESMAQQRERLGLTLERIADLRWPQNVRISPDSRYVVYEDRHYDMDGDEHWTTDLKLIDLESGHERALAKDAYGARWSPSGDRIAWVGASKDGGSQLFIQYVHREGGARQITTGGQPPSGVAWAPDGSELVFRRFVADTRNPWPIELPAPRSEFADRRGDAIVIDKLHWVENGSGIIPRGNDHLFVVSSDGKGGARQVTFGDILVGARGSGRAYRYNTDPMWSHDGAAIFFDGLVKTDYDFSYKESHLYKLELDSGEITQLTNVQGKAIGHFFDPKLSSDGKWLAFLGYEHDGPHREIVDKLWVVSVEGADQRLVSASVESEVFWFDWNPDDMALHFQAFIDGYPNHYRVRPGDPAEQAEVGNLDWFVFSESVARDGTVAGVLETSNHPGNVVVFEINHPGGGRKLTDLNPGLNDFTIGKIKRINYESTDGTPMTGWLRLPPGFDPEMRYPMILRAEGAYFYPSFNMEQWNWVSRGYVVLSVHARADEATIGFDPKHANWNFDNYLSDEMAADLLSGVDAALSQGYIDPNRLFIGGSSQGGSQSAFLITLTDRFRAASVMRPTTNAITWAYGKGGALDAFSGFSKPFWDMNSKWYADSSVLYHAHKTNTPVLIMTGTEDWGVAVAESDMYFHALKVHTDVPVRYVRLPGVHHGWGHNYATFARLQLYTLDWFRQWDIDDRERQ